jgi:cell division septation protein DedD
LKTRLLGAAVLIALAVLFVPMFFSSTPPSTGGDETVSLAIPPAPDRDLQTRTMSLTPGAAPAGTAAAPTPASSAAGQAAAPAGSDRLATVDIGSNRPRDVETDPAAGQQPAPTTVTRPGAPGQPVIPNQAQAQPPKPTTPAIADQSKPAQPKPAATPPAPAADLPAATAAHGRFTLNLSAYASTASAQNLLQRVRSLGYPVASRPLNQGGKQLTLVTAGPFDTRAAAEAARLKITQTIPGVPARLEGSAGTPAQDDAPAQAAAAPAAKPAAAPATPARAGGWAVQVAAMGSQADANALRDKLRASGFDGYVDTVNASGKQLWRVRAGPQTQRDDALRVRDQIKAKLGLAGNVVSAP